MLKILWSNKPIIRFSGLILYNSEKPSKPVQDSATESLYPASVNGTQELCSVKSLLPAWDLYLVKIEENFSFVKTSSGSEEGSNHS